MGELIEGVFGERALYAAAVAKAAENGIVPIPAPLGEVLAAENRAKANRPYVPWSSAPSRHRTSV